MDKKKAENIIIAVLLTVILLMVVVLGTVFVINTFKAPEEVREDGFEPAEYTSQGAMLEYKYFVDGYEYSDRIFAGPERGTINLIRVLALMGGECEITENGVTAEYLGMEVEFSRNPDGECSVLFNGREFDFGTDIFFSDNILSISENDFISLLTEDVIPFRVVVNESVKEVKAELMGGGGDNLKLLDVIFDENNKPVWQLIYSKNGAVTVQNTENGSSADKVTDMQVKEGVMELSANTIEVTLWDGSIAKKFTVRTDGEE